MPYFYERRLGDFNSILRKIEESIYSPVSDLKVEAWWTAEPVPYSKRRSGKPISIKEGKKWGDLFDCAWFRFTGRVPAGAKGRKVVALIDVNGEACVYNTKGEPIRGLTNRTSVWEVSERKAGKRVVQCFRKAKGGEKIDLWVDCGCNNLFGVLCGDGAFKEGRIAICNEELRALYYDFEVLFDLMSNLPRDSARHQRILYALNQACFCLEGYSEQEAAEAREALAPELEKEGGDPSLLISAVGHAHIDLAWLWPVRETLRKGARTFSTVFELMDRYPDYIFGQSQPQLYRWMKDHYPSIYRQIKKRVKEGRWEPQGGMWVESDTNLPSGESLVRQFLYGKRFFMQEFGIEVDSLWLPDAFGYSGALPQIMQQCNVPYMMTQKMSWDRFNEYPHNTFLWQGIDGSKVLMHMPPEDTYNSLGDPSSISKIERQYRDKAVCENALMLFGFGDGGGGPGAEHLERLQRAKNLQGLCPVVQEPSRQFFERLEAARGEMETWVGELYLACHQGTYTTQGRNKRCNRLMEIGLRESEFLGCLGSLIAGFNYPGSDFETIWKEVLLYQFHDVLPGSSITRVYNESLERYKRLHKQTEEITEKATHSILNAVDTRDKSNPCGVLNSLSWDREELLKIGRGWQRVKVPAMGYSVIDLEETQEAGYERPCADSNLLENDILRIKFDKNGWIVSIFDKEAKREICPKASKANVLSVYEDNGDAWDFPIHYDAKEPETFSLEKIQSRVDGPRAVRTQRMRFSDSTLKQEIVLTAGSRRIDFVTQVDWKETHRMLRTAFPTEIVTTEAACEIQFGHIKRPTHKNTTWEQAQYEVCAHKWVDLCDHTYGVALLNDSKYGYQVVDNVLDLNLLRSPIFPDPKADRARHEFTYSLYPHIGNTIDGEVIQRAYELNMPLRVSQMKSSKGTLPQEMSLVRLESTESTDGRPCPVIIECVKKAEDNRDILIRMYESTGATSRIRMRFGFETTRAYAVDLLERPVKDLKLRGNSLRLEFKPFEIKTVAVATRE